MVSAKSTAASVKRLMDLSEEAGGKVKTFHNMRFSPTVIVVLAVLAPIAFVLLVCYCLRNVPSAEEACSTTCAQTQRSGVLVHKYSWPQTAGMGGKGPLECLCR